MMLRPRAFPICRERGEQIDDPNLKEGNIPFLQPGKGPAHQQHQRTRGEAITRREATAELEQEGKLFPDWSDNKSLRFCLAYGEGFESMTCAAARARERKRACLII
ncbi:MAG: hypothetical protein CM15mP74_00060 [Halieaceae bacterium]|nr:MAG: hypothetical protein CM15mP74_00060 [Halieaceae bacterium]